jgi:hypothetical protein
LVTLAFAVAEKLFTEIDTGLAMTFLPLCRKNRLPLQVSHYHPTPSHACPVKPNAPRGARATGRHLGLVEKQSVRIVPAFGSI